MCSLSCPFTFRTFQSCQQRAENYNMNSAGVSADGMTCVSLHRFVMAHVGRQFIGKIATNTIFYVTFARRIDGCTFWQIGQCDSSTPMSNQIYWWTYTAWFDDRSPGRCTYSCPLTYYGDMGFGSCVSKHSPCCAACCVDEMFGVAFSQSARWAPRAFHISTAARMVAHSLRTPASTNPRRPACVAPASECNLAAAWVCIVSIERF